MGTASTMACLAEALGMVPLGHGSIPAVHADRLRAAQRHGSVRTGDALQMATMVLLIAQSTIQSAQIVRPILDTDALATELAYSLNGYLS